MEHYLPYLNWIDHKLDHMKELVTTWANINTYCSNYSGLEAFMQELKKNFSSLHGDMKEVDLPPHTVVDERGKKTSVPLGKALHITKRLDAPIRILLSGHMDTVFGKSSGFQTVHQTPQNTLVGPGVCDMKGGLVVLLYALEALEKSPYASKIGWEVLITPDEEIGSPGSKTVLETAAKRHHIGLIFEPAHSDGAIVSSRPGSINLVIVVRGKSAHAGRDYTAGRSALKKAAMLLLDLEALNTLKPGQDMPVDTLGSHIIVNVGELHSGSSFNIVPDLAIMRVNIRACMPKLLEEVRKQVDAAIQKHSNEDGIWIEVHEQSSRPPKIMDHATERLYRFIQECASNLNSAISTKSSGGVSDGNTLASAGLMTIDSLGPIGGKMHTHEEYVVIDSIPQRAKLASLLLMRIGNGEFVIDSKNHVIQL